MLYRVVAASLCTVAISYSSRAQIDHPFGTGRTINLDTSDTGEDLMPHLAADGAGNRVGVWASNENFRRRVGTDADIFFVRSNDAGRFWTHPRWLNRNAVSDSGADTAPQIAVDDNGNWVTVWVSEESLNGEIGSD